MFLAKPTAQALSELCFKGREVESLLYDLHIHSCLSPCADDDMTPATAVGLAKLAGAELVAITDHNSALNVPAAMAAAKAYGVKLLPGIEVNTEEEIHLLCYFPTVEAALRMGQLIYDALPAFPYDPQVWGKQIVVDADDNELYCIEKLLTGAATINIYEAKRFCEELGGIAIPAHADKDSYSLLSVMGFCPDDLDFAAIELALPESYDRLIMRGLLPSEREILTSSDAHSMGVVGSKLRELSQKSVLQRLIAKLQ